MRRLALLLAGGALWLVIAAIPALADGGPHVSTINNGSLTLTSDNCAGCHRAHTATATDITKQTVPLLCISCHGSTGTGASVDVADGIQYALAGNGSRDTGTILGALRGGGYVEARIDSSNPTRWGYLSGSSVRFLPRVGVLSSGAAVTSKHMDISLASGTSGIAWGNGALGTTGAGPTVDLNCTSCHNPHGNGQYRILNPIPTFTGAEVVSGTFTPGASAAPVNDAPLPSAGDERNYTVIQAKGTEGTNSTYLLYASQLAGYTSTQGDYFHRKVPWNSSTGANDAPNGQPSTFDTQINAWCAQCHSRYLALNTAATGTPSGIAQQTYSGDAIFAYRHSNTSNKPCTTCHVSHGSNALMTGFNSTHEYWPGLGLDPSTAADTDSRLLKVDNRGTCQMCHDPTGTVLSTDQFGPTPNPLTP